MDVSYLFLCVGCLALAAILYVARHFYDYGWTTAPILYPFFGCLFDMLANKERFLEWATENLRRAPSGTVVLMRPGETPYLHTVHPPTVEHILKNRFEIYVKGIYLQDNLTDFLGGGIFNVDDGLWSLQRKIASFEFTTRSLRDYLMEGLRHETKSRLIPTLDELEKRNQGREGEDAFFDLQDFFMRFTFDGICQLAFGVDPGALQPWFPDIKFMTAFDDATFISSLRFYEVHPIVWKIKRFFDIGSEKRLRLAIQEVHEFADNVVATRRKSLAAATSPEHLDLLSRFMSIKDVSEEDLEAIDKLYNKTRASTKRSKGKFQDRFLRDIVISFILAGRDTTSVSLCWFFWLLSKHPHVEDEIIAELSAIRKTPSFNGRTKTSDDFDDFSFDDLKEMHYLQAAISESLRLYPPVFMDPKEAREDDILPCGTRIKKGMKITYAAYAMGRMVELWGEDCLEFKPKRWMRVEENGSNPRFAGESVYKFPVFHAGPRICLGKDMAMIQMKYVAAHILPKFRLEMKSSEEPKHKLSLTLQIQGGLFVRACRR